MQTDDDSISISTPSLKSKLKSFFFSCCSRRNHHNRRQVLDSPIPPQGAASSTPSDDKPALVWLNTKATRDLNEIKDRCVTIFSGMGSGINKYRRYNSAEFRYDPLSYSLNFEDGGFGRDEEVPFGKFCPRLPPSPPVKGVAVKEITAAS